MQLPLEQMNFQEINFLTNDNVDCNEENKKESRIVAQKEESLFVVLPTVYDSAQQLHTQNLA